MNRWLAGPPPTIIPSFTCHSVTSLPALSTPTNAVTFPASFFTCFTLLNCPLGGSAIFQPVKSLPLNSGTQASSSAARAAGASAAATTTANSAIITSGRERHRDCMFDSS